MRVEDPLHFAEHAVKRAVLPADVPRAAEPVGVLAADRAAQVDHLVVQLRRQRLELAHVIVVGQVEKRPNVQLPVPHMRE